MKTVSNNPSFRIFPLLWIAGALIITSCSSGPFASADSILRKADQAFTAGKLEEAALHYRKALQKNESLTLAWYRLGLCEEKRDIAAAYLSFRQAATHDPNFVPVLVRLVELETQQFISSPSRSEKLAGSIRQRIDTIERNPEHKFDGERLEAQFQLAQAKPDSALAAFDQAIALNPKDPGVRLGRAQSLFLMRRDPEGFETLETLMRTAPTFLPAYDLASFHYSNAKRNQDTERVLEQRLKSIPGDEQSYLQLISFYLHENQRDKAQVIHQRFLADSARFPDAALHLADVYSRANQIESAVTLLKSARDTNPNKALAYDKQIAMSYLAAQNFGESRRRMEAILKQYPNDPDARGALAILKIRVKSGRELPEAVRTLEKLVQTDPRATTYLYNLALGQEANRDWRGARSSLRKLMRVEPSNLEAIAALARISLRIGDFTEASQLSQKILEFEPNHEEAQMNLAVASAGQGQLDLAISRFRDLMKRYPANREVRIQYGLVSILQNNYSLAESLLKSELRPVTGLTNDDLRIIEALAQIRLQQGKPEDAFHFLTQYADANPKIPGLAMLAGQAALRMSQPAAALKYFERVQTSDAGIAQAEVKMLLGAPTEAVTLLEQAVQNDPGNAVAWAMLGSARSRTSELPKAIEAYRRAIAINPQQPAVLNNIAYLIVLSRGNLDEAVTFANAALQQSADQPEFADTLGMVYLAKGQHSAAREIFHRLSQKVPANAVYQLHLGQALIAEGNIPMAVNTLRIARERATDDSLRREIDATQSGLAQQAR